MRPENICNTLQLEFKSACIGKPVGGCWVADGGTSAWYKVYPNLMARVYVFRWSSAYKVGYMGHFFHLYGINIFVQLAPVFTTHRDLTLLAKNKCLKV